jgi:hypothetical protein
MRVTRGEGQMDRLLPACRPLPYPERAQALRGSLPPAPTTTPLPGAGVDVFSNLLDNYWVTATGTPRHHIFVVSDTSNGSTADVPPDLLRAALDFVRTLER